VAVSFRDSCPNLPGCYAMAKVFLSYAREDEEPARRLYADLCQKGVDVWFDKVSLLPGQKWRQVIHQAIGESRYFVALLSSNSVTKRGFVQKELKVALNQLDEFPDPDIFIIPVRLDNCVPSHERLRDLHCVDLFPSWEEGFGRILRSIDIGDEGALAGELAHDRKPGTAKRLEFDHQPAEVRIIPPRVSVAFGGSQALERGARWHLEYYLEAKTVPVTDVTLVLEHPTVSTEAPARPPLPVLELGQRQRVHLLVRSSTILEKQTPLEPGQLVVHYAEITTGERFRTVIPVEVFHAGTLDLQLGAPVRVERGVRQPTAERATNMELGQYQGFTIKAEPARDASLRSGLCWFNVYEGEEWAICLMMQVTDPFASRYEAYEPTQVVELAVQFGHHWVHGLIDLARFDRGKTYKVIMTSEWDPYFGEGDLTDEDLRRELLKAIQRLNRAQQGASTILSIDVDGIAVVLGVRPERVRGLLSELLIEGLVEPYAETFGHLAEDGACRITGDGLRALREDQSPTTGPAQLLSVDDIDSFAKVRSIKAEQVADLLDARGVLPFPEAKVKDAICSIVDEPYQDKDWGGERSDVFTTRVVYQGRRIPTAMLLKGPAVGPVLYPAGLGKRGDQDLRLFNEPAEILIVQFNGKIDSAVYQRLRTQAEHRGAHGQRTLLCVIDGADTARLLRAYGFA